VQHPFEWSTKWHTLAPASPVVQIAGGTALRRTVYTHPSAQARHAPATQVSHRQNTSPPPLLFIFSEPLGAPPRTCRSPSSPGPAAAAAAPPPPRPTHPLPAPRLPPPSPTQRATAAVRAALAAAAWDPSAPCPAHWRSRCWGLRGPGPIRFGAAGRGGGCARTHTQGHEQTALRAVPRLGRASGWAAGGGGARRAVGRGSSRAMRRRRNAITPPGSVAARLEPSVCVCVCVCVRLTERPHTLQLTPPRFLPPPCLPPASPPFPCVPLSVPQA
jgi:hypothetical protein